VTDRPVPEEPLPFRTAGCFLRAAERGVRRRGRDASALAPFSMLTNVQAPSISRPLCNTVNEILAARKPIWDLMPLKFRHGPSTVSISAAPEARPLQRPIVSLGWWWRRRPIGLAPITVMGKRRSDGPRRSRPRGTVRRCSLMSDSLDENLSRVPSDSSSGGNTGQTHPVAGRTNREKRGLHG
jgi:hypothetical protein